MSISQVLSTSVEANVASPTEGPPSSLGVISRKSAAPVKRPTDLSTSITTTTTTETKLDSHLLSSSNPTHALTQTGKSPPVVFISHEAPPAEVDLIGKETKIQIEFAHFDRVLLRENEKRLDVDKAARTMTKGFLFKQRMKRYVDAIEEVNEAEEGDRDFSAAEDALMALVNYIVSTAPKCGLKSPYRQNMYYLREHGGDSDESASGSGTRSSSGFGPPFGLARQSPRPSRSNVTPASEGEEDHQGPPPRCIGVIRAETDEVQYLWEDVAVAFDVGPSMSDPDDRLPSELINERSGMKRKAISNLPRQTKKRRKTTPSPPASPSPNDITVLPPDTAVSSYALEMLHALGNRRHALTVNVTGLGIRFVYFDRAGCIYTTKLNLMEDEVKVASAFINLSLCNASSLGLEPNLESGSSSSPSLILLKNCRLSVDGHEFIPDRILHSSPSMYGRGTTVYAAKTEYPAGGKPSEIPDTVVVKLSWQITTHRFEDEMYRIAAQCGVVDGVPKLYCSRVGGRLSEGLRGRLVPTGTYVDRELRIQILGPVCIPLHQLTDLDEFKQAFISLVQVHHDLYRKAGILHRDISANNLMVDPNNRNRGILIDFDLAAQLMDDGKQISSVKLPPAGTIPFRSLELLQDEPPTKSYYRHDLESFFYVLAWILGRYNQGKILNSTNALFRDWHTGEWSQILNSKRGFLGLCRRGNFSYASFPSLQRTWLPKLAGLLLEGYLAKRDTTAPSLPHFGHEMKNKYISFESFMDVLLNVQPV